MTNWGAAVLSPLAPVWGARNGVLCGGAEALRHNARIMARDTPPTRTAAHADTA